MASDDLNNPEELHQLLTTLYKLCENNHNRLTTLETTMERMADTMSRLNHRQVQTEIGVEDPDLQVTVQYLLGRVEFVRRELMYELRYADKISASPALEVATKVLNEEKLANAQQDKIRLNLGCGHIPLPDYLNIDMREVSGVDIVAEADRLPFGNAQVDEIFSSHFLEHFPEEQLRRQLLPYWRSLLKPGGSFRAVVPDGDAMIREFEKGRFAYKDLREALYGAQEYQGDFHFNLFTPESLTQLLQEAGFTRIDIITAGRRNGSCFEFEIKALRN